MDWLINIGLYFWGLFKTWIFTIFIAPFKHGNMLWLLIPIWVTWFFSEFFQEKHGTSMGNAITNSVVVIWGSIDCTRQTVSLISAGVITSLGDMILRFVIVAFILGYGIAIVVLGLKGNKIIKYIGRVREVTYAFAIFAPVFYNAIPLTLNHLISAVLFFPLFYFGIELIDRYTPNPKAVVEDMEDKDNGKSKDSDFSDFGSSSSSDVGSSKSSSGLGDSSSSKDKGKSDDFGDLKF